MRYCLLLNRDYLSFKEAKTAVATSIKKKKRRKKERKGKEERENTQRNQVMCFSYWPPPEFSLSSVSL